MIFDTKFYANYFINQLNKKKKINENASKKKSFHYYHQKYRIEKQEENINDNTRSVSKN